MEPPVTLIIKAPNQKYTDQAVSCCLDWTVGRLKSHLAQVYPSKPLCPSCALSSFLTFHILDLVLTAHLLKLSPA
uniref:Homocysteine-responsive endoplasmic reticulum-resident ubiquitin-like domain member 2 protein n=1 Tax=Sphaerodactylus townsendi TaxID=933632 RepID=A0ACB8FTL4_9SAUR